MTLRLLEDFKGVDPVTGTLVSGDDHLRLSLRAILTTLIGSCVMDRDFGSRVPALLDAPIGPAVIADLVSATAEAIYRWEPRVVLKRVLVASAAAGRLSVDLLVEIKGRVVMLEGVI